MTLLYKTNEKERTRLANAWYLELINSKTSEDEHKSITSLLYEQQMMINSLIQDNKELWDIVKTLDEKQITSTQHLAAKIWDNKEDEFWDTL